MWRKGNLGETAARALAVDEQALLDIDENSELQVVVKGWRLQEVQAVAVNGADKHLGETLVRAQDLFAEGVDAVLQLARSLFGESEGDDVARSDA